MGPVSSAPIIKSDPLTNIRLWWSWFTSAVSNLFHPSTTTEHPLTSTTKHPLTSTTEEPLTSTTEQLLTSTTEKPSVTTELLSSETSQPEVITEYIIDSDDLLPISSDDKYDDIGVKEMKTIVPL